MGWLRHFAGFLPACLHRSARPGRSLAALHARRRKAASPLFAQKRSRVAKRRAAPIPPSSQVIPLSLVEGVRQCALGDAERFSRFRGPHGEPLVVLYIRSAARRTTKSGNSCPQIEKKQGQAITKQGQARDIRQPQRRHEMVSHSVGEAKAEERTRTKAGELCITWVHMTAALGECHMPRGLSNSECHMPQGASKYQMSHA